MNSNDLLIHFLDWFDNEYPDSNKPEQELETNDEDSQMEQEAHNRKNSFEVAAAARLSQPSEQVNEVITPRGISQQ